MKNFLNIPLFACCLLSLKGLSQEKQTADPGTLKSSLSKVWIADNGDGTYKNPILHADYSDPDAIRVGDDYYMTASSFNCMPGLPILHSKDLVNWNLIGYALKKQVPVEVFDVPMHGKGVWAPSIRYRNGEFLIYYPDPDYGIYLIKTKDIKGEWSKPQLVLPGKGIIDPAPFWDEDGKAYLAVAWAGSRAGVNSLLTLYSMNAAGDKVIDEGRNVYSGHDYNHTIEGPKLYKKDGFYYIFAPAGGVATGWQLVLRSKKIYGPYDEKIVMDQGSSVVNGPHQGAWLETPKGESWFLHFQDKGAYGRVVHLQPMKWVNNWPVIGNDPDGDGKGEPVLNWKKPVVAKNYPLATPPESDEFNDSSLGLQWQWHANPKVTWSFLNQKKGVLRMFSVPQPLNAVNLWPSPNLLLQKFPAENFSATTKIKLSIEWDVWQGKKAGLLIMGNDYSYLSIGKNESGYLVQQVICNNALTNEAEKVLVSVPVKTGEVYLRVEVKGPDAKCAFSFSEDGINYIPIGDNFVAKPDKWIGAKVGLFCNSRPDVRTGSFADVDWFRVDK